MLIELMISAGLEFAAAKYTLHGISSTIGRTKTEADNYHQAMENFDDGMLRTFEHTVNLMENKGKIKLPQALEARHKVEYRMFATSFSPPKVFGLP